MLEDRLLLSLLDTKVEAAIERIKDHNAITIEEAVPLLLKSQFNHIAHLDESITEIKLRLGGMATKVDQMATKDDLTRFATKEDLNRFATKDDLTHFATKADIANMATKNDLTRMATKEDLARFATKEDLAHFATKEDFARCATKEDIANVVTKMEMKEDLARIDRQFERIDQRFAHVDARFEQVYQKIYNQTVWMTATMIALSGIVIGVVKYL